MTTAASILWLFTSTLTFMVPYLTSTLGLIEIMGPLGLQRLFHFLTFNLELLATGFLPHYALLLLSLSWLAALYLSISNLNLRLYFGYDLGVDVGVGLCGLIVSSAGK